MRAWTSPGTSTSTTPTEQRRAQWWTAERKHKVQQQERKIQKRWRKWQLARLASNRGHTVPMFFPRSSSCCCGNRRISNFKVSFLTITCHSDSLDTLLYVWFAGQNLEFYEWKLRGCGWAFSWRRTYTIFAPWPHVAPCFTYKKKQNAKKSSLSWVTAVSKLSNSIEKSMYPYERGSVSTVVCHLFVVGLPERSASLCVVSGERRLISNDRHGVISC